MLHIGRAGHPEPDRKGRTNGFLSVEFADVGGWLTHGDFAMDSCAQFLAVAEHRLIPAWARSIGHQLRRAHCQSVWIKFLEGVLVWGVISLGGAPSLPRLLLPLEFPLSSASWVRL